MIDIVLRRREGVIVLLAQFFDGLYQIFTFGLSTTCKPEGAYLVDDKET